MFMRSISLLLLAIALGLTNGCGDVGMDCRSVLPPALICYVGKQCDIPIKTTKKGELLTTITATYDQDLSEVNPKIMGSFDTIDFNILDSTGGLIAIPLQIAFEFSTRSSQNGIRMMGFRNKTDYGWDGNHKDWKTNPAFNYMRMFDGPKGSFSLQILQTDSGYKIQIRPGGSPFFETIFNYNSATVWDEYSKYRLSESNAISINKGMPRPRFSRIMKFQSISQCRDALPILCDAHIQIVPVILGGYAPPLHCRAYGAPFLSSKWSKPGGEPVRIVHKENVVTIGAGTTIDSELEIPVFSLNDIGLYTCEIRNDFGQNVTKEFILQYFEEISFISKPRKSKFHAEDEVSEFSWLLEGYPLDVHLNCSSQAGVDVRHTYILDKSPPRINLTTTINPKTASDVVNCTVFRVNGSQVFKIDTLQITRSEDNGDNNYWKISTFICIGLIVIMACFATICQVCKCRDVLNKDDTSFELMQKSRKSDEPS